MFLQADTDSNCPSGPTSCHRTGTEDVPFGLLFKPLPIDGVSKHLELCMAQTYLM